MGKRAYPQVFLSSTQRDWIPFYRLYNVRKEFTLKLRNFFAFTNAYCTDNSSNSIYKHSGLYNISKNYTKEIEDIVKYVINDIQISFYISSIWIYFKIVNKSYTV